MKLCANYHYGANVHALSDWDEAFVQQKGKHDFGIAKVIGSISVWNFRQYNYLKESLSIFLSNLYPINYPFNRSPIPHTTTNNTETIITTQLLPPPPPPTTPHPNCLYWKSYHPISTHFFSTLLPILNVHIILFCRIT